MYPVVVLQSKGDDVLLFLSVLIIFLDVHMSKRLLSCHHGKKGNIRLESLDELAPIFRSVLTAFPLDFRRISHSTGGIGGWLFRSFQLVTDFLVDILPAFAF